MTARIFQRQDNRLKQIGHVHSIKQSFLKVKPTLQAHLFCAYALSWRQAAFPEVSRCDKSARPL